MKPKVAILVNSLLAGGAERFVSLLINNLNDDYEFHLLVLENIIEYELPLGQIVVDLGSSGIRSADLRNFFRLPFVANQLRKYCKENEIPLVISFMNRPNLAACLAKLMGLKARVLISERTHTGSIYKRDTMRGRLGRLLVRLFYPRADAILPNSKGTQETLEREFGVRNRYIVVKNAIVLADIPSKAEEPVDDFIFNKFTFICVAGFRLQKNHRALINAFAKLDRSRSQLILIGKGYEEHGEGFRTQKEMEELVISAGLSENVFFLGQRSNPFKYLRRADCFVLASDFEGFPNVLIEAMACGLPIVSTDCPTGPRELLAPDSFGHSTKLVSYEIGEYGILVPVGNEFVLADAMNKMMEDKELRSVFRSRYGQKVAEYDCDIVMNEFKLIIKDQLSH